MKLNKLNNIVKDHKGKLGGAGVGVVGSGLIGNLGLATLGTAIGLPSAWILVPFGFLVDRWPIINRIYLYPVVMDTPGFR